MPTIVRRARLILLTALLVLASLATASTQQAHAALGVNDYPSNLATAARDSLVDPWGFYNRECTSFVAWRMNNDNHVAFSNNMSGPNGTTGHFGDATNWAANAASIGYNVNTSPAIGSIAVWPSTIGHVAYVDAVNADGTINTEEYNWSGDGAYHTRTNYNWSAANVQFIHVNDISGAGSWNGVGTATFLGSDTLPAGQQLSPNQYLLSTDARFALILQTDGNLVLYSGHALWQSGTAGSGATHLVMQTDGNLVLYTASNAPVWQTSTSGTGQAHLVVQSDGNLVTYSDSSGSPTWQSGTAGAAPATAFGSDTLAAAQQLNASTQQYLLSADKRYGLLMQSDGTAVLYGPGYHVLWSHHNDGATRLVMQTDGNLVLYNGNTALWSTGTSGTGPGHAVMQTDGNFVTYTSGNTPTWQTGTRGP